MNICDRLLCTGCGACSNLCPAGCIEMREDEIGHLYPFVDEDKCVNCGLCKKRCPVNTGLDTYAPKKAYATWSLDENEHSASTSGGFANVVSRKIISMGGSVYGSALTDEGIQHIRVNTQQELERLQGSKYVQSPVCGVYKMLKADLKNGKKVLFVGTPCQCAGVKAYLGRDYDELHIVSLICMGVPPQKLLWEELGYIDKKPQKISFRGKEGSMLSVIDGGKVVYSKPSYKNCFYKGFYAKLYFRESCYSCSFKGMERCSDITIGDFWGLGRIEPFEHKIKNGVSVAMPHTEKGIALIDECRDELFIEERTVEEAVRDNSMYRISAKKHRNYDKFKKYYIKKGCRYAIRKTLIKERIYSFGYQSLKKIYRKLKGVK